MRAYLLSEEHRTVDPPELQAIDILYTRFPAFTDNSGWTPLYRA
jgi:hypothetical protein